MVEEVENLLEVINDIEHLGLCVDRVIRNINNVSRRPKFYVRNQYNQNPYNLFAENEFISRYRFSKHTVLEIILPLIKDELESKSLNRKGLPVPPEIQILIALRFYATGTFQLVCADLVNFSQATVCRIVRKVSLALAKKYCRFIKFPANEQATTFVKQNFEKLGRNNSNRRRRPGLFNIIGAIDCTHIRIKRPRGIRHSKIYRNRKGYFSLNVQVIVGPNMEIFDIVTRWPGNIHDSRIFRNSKVNSMLLSGRINGILVGDGGYACTRHLLTPINGAITVPQARYNRAQRKTRNPVERCFGIWKKRFPCLQLELRNKLSTTCNIIVACAVLHNIGIQNADTPIFDNNDISSYLQPPQLAQQPTLEGLALRNVIINTQFSYMVFHLQHPF